VEDILYQLFNGDYDITPERGEKQQELLHQICHELDQVQATLGDKFLDRLGDLEGELDDWYQYQYYRAGFLLGARLMLEVLER